MIYLPTTYLMKIIHCAFVRILRKTVKSDRKKNVRQYNSIILYCSTYTIYNYFLKQCCSSLTHILARKIIVLFACPICVNIETDLYYDIIYICIIL